MTRQELLKIAKPILFNTDMVRAILDDIKECTRRIIKEFIPNDAVWGYTIFTPEGYISCRGTYEDGHGEKFFKLPYRPEISYMYGKHGDGCRVLIVTETLGNMHRAKRVYLI